MSGILLSNYSQTSVQAGERSPSDFLFFNHENIKSLSSYKIFIEDLSGKWYTLGAPAKRVALPPVYFPDKAGLVVVGKDASGNQVRYVGELHRGHLYLLGKATAGDQYMRHVIPQYYN